MRIVFIIITLMFPIKTVEIVPDHTIEYYENRKQELIEEQAKQMFYINANIYRLSR